jgi:hypothetical protein
MKRALRWALVSAGLAGPAPMGYPCRDSTDVGAGRSWAAWLDRVELTTVGRGHHAEVAVVIPRAGPSGSSGVPGTRACGPSSWSRSSRKATSFSYHEA